jgi:hypothetical protein
MRSRKTADLDSLTNVDPAALGRVFFEIWASLDSQTSELNANARARAPGSTLILPGAQQL